VLKDGADRYPARGFVLFDEDRAYLKCFAARLRRECISSHAKNGAGLGRDLRQSSRKEGWSGDRSLSFGEKRGRTVTHPPTGT
jgi:hypothetical protein